MVPKLFDRAALVQNRQRRAGADHPAYFPFREAAEVLSERLVEVNRTFTAPAVVTGHPDLFETAFPQATFVPDTETLALSPGAHDLVLHVMALHWANDPLGQIIQCRRALRPDGLFLGVAFGGQTLRELRVALTEAEARVLGGLSPRMAPMADTRDLGGLLQRADLALPVTDCLALTAEYRTLGDLAGDLRAMGETNALADRLKSATRRAVFSEAERIYRDNYAAASGRLLATFELVFLTGWAPAASQPKPLRPGSAQARLADALGTTEQTADGTNSKSDG